MASHPDVYLCSPAQQIVMASHPDASVYPGPLFHAPVCTSSDFSQGDFNFTAFYALYHQFNPGNPPSLQYVRDHWILLVTRLFPDDDDKSQGECAVKRGVWDSVGQALRLQAYGSAVSRSGQVDVHDDMEEPSWRGASSSLDKNHTEVDGTTKSFEVEMVSIGVGDKTDGAKRAEIGGRVWRGGGFGVASSEKSKLLTQFETGKASASPRSVTTSSKERLGRWKDSGPSSHLHGQSNSQRRRGTRAGRQTRESNLRKLSNSVGSLVLDADRIPNSQRRQIKQTDEMITTYVPQNHAHDAGEMPSVALPRCRGTRDGRQKRESDLRRLSNSVGSLALEADLHSDSNSQIHQTKQTDEMVTIQVPQHRAHDTDEMPPVSVGRDQNDTVYLRPAPAWQFVDPCSLSQSELDSAIIELVRSVQSQMANVHANRLRLLYRTGWT